MSEIGQAEGKASQTGAGASARQPRRQRWLVTGAVLLVAAGAALWLRHEAEPRERDYHAIRKEFQRIERKIREHDMGIWLVVEGEPHDEDAGAADQQERHRRILDDLELLRRAQKFVLSGVEIEIDGDRAHLRYTLQSWPQPWRPMPAGGQMEFVRRQGRWVLEDHHFRDKKK